MAIINQQLGQEFESRFKTLPEDIQKALTAVASVDTIFAIGKKHGLMVDQIGKMADEIWKVMLGLANPRDFIRNLAGLLGIESEKASAIANDVNAQMFQTVRESLRKIYDQIPPAVQENITPPTKMLPASLSPSAPSYGAYPKGGGKEDNEISPLKLRGARGVTEMGRGEGISSMIFPQNRFEEEFKKEPEQIAPLVPTITPSKGDEELLYPEKTKEISREPASPAGGPAANQGGYKSRDPYRESIEE